MSHANPLHPPVPTDRLSPFTTLGDALGLTPLPSTPSVDPNANEFTFPHRRRRLPQVISHPACKWLQATSKKGQSLREHAVLFDYVGHSGEGIPMRELTARGSAALTQIMLGPSDKVFEGKGCRRITLRIMWPGYLHLDWARSIEVETGGASMTRVQLGCAVSTIFSRFLELNRNETCTDPKYKIAADSIQFEHLILIGLHNVYEDVWQADVGIDVRC